MAIKTIDYNYAANGLFLKTITSKLGALYAAMNNYLIEIEYRPPGMVTLEWA